MIEQATIEIGEWVAEVNDAIRGGRIGRPVAARMHAFAPVAPADLQQCADTLTAKVSTWFQSDLVNVEPQRSSEESHLTLMAVFADGETALLSFTAIQRPEPRYDLLLIGTRGTIRFE